MGNLNIPAKRWLKELFEYEYCDECGGGAEHHKALPLLGNWFAQCKYPPSEDSVHPEGWHPVIQEYRGESIVKVGDLYRVTFSPDLCEYKSLKTAQRALQMRRDGFKGWPLRGRWDGPGDPKHFKHGGPGKIQGGVGRLTNPSKQG